MIQVSVVIPNYNGEDFLGNCLASLKKQSFKDFEVILVDNGSEDNSVFAAKVAYPGLRTVELGKNTGFAHAVNEGIKAAQGEYVILLNNDTIAFPAFVANQYKMIKSRPDVFSCSALMIQNARRDLADDAGDEFCVLGWGFAPDRDRPVKECGVPHEVFSACGGAAVYRREVFNKIGLFDERFFAYLEDMDIGWRARLSGYRNLYNPHARVYHIGSGTSAAGSAAGGGKNTRSARHNAFKVELSARNSIYLIKNNMPLWQILLNVPFFMAGIVIKTAYFSGKGLGAAYLTGIKNGFKGIFLSGEDGRERFCQEIHAKEGDARERTEGEAVFDRLKRIKSCLTIQGWLYRGLAKRAESRKWSGQ